MAEQWVSGRPPKETYKVHITGSDVSSSGGTSAADDADFTDGTTAGTPAMGVYESTPTTVTDGDLGVVAIDENRNLKVNIVAGSSSGTEYTEGDADTTITGTAVLAEGASNVLTPLQVDASKHLQVDIAADSVGIGGGTQYTEDAAAEADPVGNALMMVRDDALSGQTTTDGDNVAARGTDKGELYVKHSDTIAVTQSGTWDEVGINDSGNSITVDNAGLTELAAAINASSQIDVNIADSNATVTVTGAVDLGATDNAVLDAIAASVAAIDTDTTAIIADTTNIETAVQLIDDTVYTDDTSTHATGTSKGLGIMAAATPTDGSVGANDIGMVAMSLDRRLHTDTQIVGQDANLTVDLGATDNAVLDNIDADLTTVIGHVDGIETLLGTIDSDTGGILTSVQTLDNAISGSEMQVDVVAALPAGTNAIGKLAANSGVDIGDVDVTSLPALAAGTNAIGKLLPPDVDVTTHTNYAKKYYTNSGAVTDGIIWSPAAGKRWHVTTLYINVSAAATVTLEDDKSGGDEAVWKGELAANSGVVLTYPEKYPFASGEDAADLTITTSAGNVYVQAVGYEI